MNTKTTLRTLTTLTLTLISPLAAHAQPPASPPAAPDLYAGIKSYDYLNRPPVAAVWQIIRSNPDKATRESLETGLIGVLQDPAATVAGKQEACRMLSVIGTRKSVPALAALLPDPALSDPARYALERNPDRAAVGALRDALKTLTGKPLVGVIDSVADRRDTNDLSMIIQCANSNDPAVVLAAKRAQAKITENISSEPPMQLPFTGDEASSVVSASRLTAHASSRELSDALAAYPKMTAPVQTALLTGFSLCGDKDAAPLVEAALTSPDPTLRFAAIQAATGIEGAKAIPSLAAIAATGAGRDKNAARMALAQIPGADADRAILGLSRTSPDPAERAALLDVLAARQSPAYHASLLDAARGGDPKVAVAAIKSFAQAGTVADEPALVAILTGTADESVRDTAGEALASIGQKAADHSAAAQPLVEALPKATPPAQAALVTALAQIGGGPGIAAVGGAAGSANADVKSAAVTGLSETTTDPAALPVLWNLAKTDPDHGTRVQALRGYVRLLAASDRMPVGEKVTDLKAAIALAERPEEKKAALGALRTCRTPAAMELAAASLDDPAVFDEAADAVLTLAAPAKVGNRTVPAVKGPATIAALARVAANAKDDTVREKAQALQAAK